MKLRVGYELQYAFPQPTPAILMLNIHFTRVAGLAAPDHIVITPPVPISGYRDGFGNWCCRIVAPKGKVSISTNVVITGDTAAITYKVLFAGTSPYPEQDGTVQRVDGVWVVARDQFCGFMAMARNPCT